VNKTAFRAAGPCRRYLSQVLFWTRNLLESYERDAFDRIVINQARRDKSIHELNELAKPENISKQTQLPHRLTLGLKGLISTVFTVVPAYITYLSICQLVAASSLILTTPLAVLPLMLCAAVFAPVSVISAGCLYGGLFNGRWGMSQQAFNTRLSETLIAMTDHVSQERNLTVR